MISSVDLAHNGVFRAKDWVSVDCGTTQHVSADNDLIFNDTSAHRGIYVYTTVFIRL